MGVPADGRRADPVDDEQARDDRCAGEERGDRQRRPARRREDHRREHERDREQPLRRREHVPGERARSEPEPVDAVAEDARVQEVAEAVVRRRLQAVVADPQPPRHEHDDRREQHERRCERTPRRTRDRSDERAAGEHERGRQSFVLRHRSCREEDAGERRVPRLALDEPQRDAGGADRPLKSKKGRVRLPRRPQQVANRFSS